MAQDGFYDWLKETFAADSGGLDDVLVADQAMATGALQQSQQMLPDTAVLIQQMQNSLTQHDTPEPANIPVKQECQDIMQSAAVHSQAEDAKAGNQRPKNTKRYKSLAQKEAHKRYRERKRASITAMEHTVNEMLQQLKELEAENEQLKSKCRVLETSVNCSTQIHGLMQLLDGFNGLSVNSEDSNSPASGSRSVGHFGLQATDRMNSIATSDTSGGDAWSSDSSLLPQQQQQQQQQSYPPSLLQQQQQVQVQDPWQRMAQSRVVTTGTVSHPAAAAATAVGLPAAANNVVTGFNQVWNAVHHPQQQQQQQQHATNILCDAPYGSGSSSGSSNGSWANRSAAHGTTSIAAAPAGPVGTDSTDRNSLQAIFAEAQQQQQQREASSSPHIPSDSPHHPLAGAVTSVEQGMGTYKSFLRQASHLLLQIDAAGPDAEAASATLEELTRVTMSRLQPLLVAQGQHLVYNWITRNLETGLQQEAPEELWPKVLDQMKLSPQQQQDALACYRMFSICLSKLVDKRVELSEHYRALQQHSEHCEMVAQQPQHGKAEAAAAYRKVKLTSASMEVLQSLAKNLAAYQSLDGVFAHSVTSLLTGVQMAAACVHSYPFLPQWHTMMRLLMLREDARQQALQETAGQAAPRRSGRNIRSSLQATV